MSESGEVEVAQAAFPVLPKEVSAEIGSIKLFNKWSYEDVEIKDISLTYAVSRRWLADVCAKVAEGFWMDLPATIRLHLWNLDGRG
jgi:hypothetical protein